MAEHEGWSYLDSGNMDEFSERTIEEGWASQNSDGSGSFYGDDGSWGFTNADGSGSYYGADGSWGFKNADGSGSFYGEDGSWGFRNADGSGSFYGEGDDWGHWDSSNGKTYYGDSDDDTDTYSNSNSEDFEVADALGAAIGADLFAAAVNRSKRKEKEEELKRAREEEERERQEKAAMRAEWRKSPAGREARKVKLIAIIVLIIALAIALLVSSLKVIGHSSSEMIGSDHGEVAEQLSAAGFWNVEQVEISDLVPSQAEQDGLVTDVKIGIFNSFTAELRMPCFIKPEVTYHTLASLDPPFSSEDVKGMGYQEVVSAFEGAGYLDVVAEPRKDVVVGLFNKEGEVFEIRIGDTKSFTTEDHFKPNSTITIAYHSKVFD